MLDNNIKILIAELKNAKEKLRKIENANKDLSDKGMEPLNKRKT